MKKKKSNIKIKKKAKKKKNILKNGKKIGKVKII
jgi:hypothetical protein